jgi:uncharacterized protein (TIGR00255 family)
MTGFGAADRHVDGVSFRTEIRSLNGRYFKLAMKLPEELAALEPVVERRLRERLGRGSITYTLSVRDESPQAAQQLNLAALQSYVDGLQQIRGLEKACRIDLAGLVALPGVCQPRTLDEATRREFQETLETITDEAINRLIEMRRLEGTALRKDLLAHCASIRGLADQVRKRAPTVVEEYHQKLRARVNALLASGEIQLDQDNLIREIAPKRRPAASSTSSLRKCSVRPTRSGARRTTRRLRGTWSRSRP